jgi:Putative transposase/Transposase zinc-binding domain
LGQNLPVSPCAGRNPATFLAAGIGMRRAERCGMAPASSAYRPRIPAERVLYQIVREHFETFRAQAAGLREGEGLPRFVEQEFRDFLRCGVLAAGFARLRCAACGWERLLPFSCKGRGFCPSCGGRRMCERAAHLVDHVIPPVPVRQWVLTFPPRLRYALAWDHDLCRAVIGVYMRAVVGFLRHAARQAGAGEGRGGGVAILQRFGGAVNLNVHVHALVLDGVFAAAGEGLRFWPLPALTDADVADVLATVVPRLRRLLVRRGLSDDETDDGAVDRWREEAPVLAGLAAASVQGRVSLGGRAGAPVQRNVRLRGDEGDAAWDLGPCHARQARFDLHAAVRVPGGRRARLERLCRYALRPPVGQDRLRVTADGQVVVTLRRAWSDGTTAIVLEPTELLAVLTPRPRVNLVLYHGVLAPRAAWRQRVVAFRASEGVGAAGEPGEGEPPARPTGRGRRWAALMARSFGIDVLACPRCGGRLRLLALVAQAAVIARILQHLGLPTEVPAARPARSPPRLARNGADDRNVAEFDPP